MLLLWARRVLHHSNRGSLASLGFLLLLVVFGFGCRAERTPLLRVGVLVWPPYEMPFLAQKLGYYEGSSIELVDFTSPANALRAFESGSVDAVTLTLDFALKKASNGMDPNIIMAIARSLGGDVVIARSPFDSFRSLRGHRIGVETSPLGIFVLKSALRSEGLKPRDFDIVSVDVSEHVLAFEEGLVDALVTYEPFSSRILESGGSIVFDSSKMETPIVDVLLASDEAISRHDEQLESLVSGWLRAVDHFRENPERSAELISDRGELNSTQFLEAMENVELFGLEENLEFIAEDSRKFRDLARRHGDAMIEFGMLPASFQADDIFLPEFVRAAEREIVATR